MSQTKAELVNGLSVNAAADDAITVDSSGKVGIGTTSPSAKLHLFGSADDFEGLRLTNNLRNDSAASSAQIKFDIRNSGGFRTARIEAREKNTNNNECELNFYTNSSASQNGEVERMTISGTGNVGIGTTSPVTAMHIANTDDPVTILLQNTDSNTPTDSGGEIIFKGTKTNGDPVFFGGVGGRRRNQASDVTGYLALYRQNGDGSNNAVEAMRIDHSGNVGIGTTAPDNADSADGGFHVKPNHSNGAPQAAFKRAASGNLSHCIVFVDGSVGKGSIAYNDVGTSYNTSSDYRLKENVVAISDGITRLKTLKPSRFNFKVNKDKTVDGFLAHEVTAVPEATTGTKDEVDSDNNPVYQAIDQSKLVPLLTAALQEEIAKREALETRVAALEAA